MRRKTGAEQPSGPSRVEHPWMKRTNGDARREAMHRLAMVCTSPVRTGASDPARISERASNDEGLVDA